MGERDLAPVPTAVYGIVLICCAIAYTILQTAIQAEQGTESTIARAVGNDKKGKISIGLYVIAIGLAFISPRGSIALYVLVALIWFVPDRRIEAALR
jgi:uncharacterized membrane protein